MFNFTKQQFNADDALAALNAISVFLFDDYRDAITNCEDKKHFIIMTIFWHDVLASAGLMNVSDDSADVPSMLLIMGCENRIVWAIAQISSLYVWKQSREKEGNLGFTTILELFQRTKNIESNLPPPDLRRKVTVGLRPVDDVSRLLASEAFRTVVHDNIPSVPEIAEAVNDAIGSLE
ncbi:hypothetical protein GYMLUDRAFT_250449 [Collybiopsis luxurians FD-317 M1]|uniref:Uncharacterized protein n=1 Tax=Collybiopsis luxurians FD-317 M1 TaxID=944289 RepID=A0A0D0ASE2_9AGAR|nr:hypothetical protein GYMLUDRAFT_250449 [Collybiopsis luxurians FD-317 M1]